MAERRAKLVKTLKGTSLNTNISQLKATLDALQSCSAEELDAVLSTSRSSLSRAVHEDVADLMWTMPLPLKSGGSFDCPAPSFSKMLQRICRTSPAIRGMLKDIWERNPATALTPLGLCIYGDEIIPGNVLRLDYSRKMFLMFISITALGPTILKSTDAWIPFFAIRSNILKDVIGGFSLCLRLLLRRLLLDEKVGENGVVVSLDEDQSTHVALHFCVSNLILDGDAQRQAFNSTGARGKVPCLCCLNVVHDDAAIPSPDFVSLTNTDASKLQICTSEDLYEKADTLSRTAPPHMRVGRHRQLQTAMGLRYFPDGLLWDKDLRRHMRMAEAITFDSMHVLLVNGMACDEISFLFGVIMDRTVMRRRVTWDHLRTFVDADFCFCHCYHITGKVSKMLSSAREERYNKDGTIAFGAAEVLLLVPLILYFLEVVVVPSLVPPVAPAVPLAVTSFRALARVIALTQAGKLGRTDADHLAHAIRVHGEAYQASYGSSTKTKPHWLLHIPSQLSRDGWIMDAFVGERANNTVKRVAAEVDNVHVLEKSVASRSASRFLQRVAKPLAFRDHLIKPERCAGLVDGGDALAATSFVWEGLALRRSDVILVNDTPVLVNAGVVASDDTFCVLGHSMGLVQQVTDSASRWRPGALSLWQLTPGCVRTPAAWHRHGGHFVILMP